MALLLAEAQKLSNNELEVGVVEEVIDKEDLFAVLPFKGVNGKAYLYNREATLATGDFLDPNEAVNESASTFEEVVAKLRILIGDVDVDKFLAGTMSDTNDQKATQIQAKAKGMARQFKETLVTGDNTTYPKQFDGIGKLVDSDQTFAAGDNGASIDMSLLDRLLDMVPNGADVIFMHSAVVRAYRALLRSIGYTAASELMLPAFGRPMLTHNGVPILVNDFLPLTEDQGTALNTTSIYAARLNEVDGLHGIYGGGTAGFVVEDIGTVQNKDATRTRIKWYVGLALKSTRSLARLKGITNVT